MTDNNRNPRVGWTNFSSFTWCIDDFKMKMEIGECLDSEVFSFRTNAGNTSWYLYALPNGDKEDEEDEGGVGVYLLRLGVYEFPVQAEVAFSIINKEGKKALTHSRAYTFKEHCGDDWVGFSDFVPHIDLVMFQDSSLNLLPDNTLTILCEISIAGDSGTRKPYKGELERDVSLCAKTDSMNRLSSDMLSMAAGDKFVDFEILCDGQKFPCHKSVLASRSPVFDAMFSHDMEENRRSSVDILDLDCNTVRNMMVYIYSGHVDALEDKATGLLAAAEKYDLKELKQMCEISLSENITKDNVLDTVVLADLHGAVMVRDIALKFIVFNGEEIVTQPDWREKLEGHPRIIADIFEVAMKNKSNIGK